MAEQQDDGDCYRIDHDRQQKINTDLEQDSEDFLLSLKRGDGLLLILSIDENQK